MEAWFNLFTRSKPQMVDDIRGSEALDPPDRPWFPQAPPLPPRREK